MQILFPEQQPPDGVLNSCKGTDLRFTSLSPACLPVSPFGFFFLPQFSTGIPFHHVSALATCLPLVSHLSPTCLLFVSLFMHWYALFLQSDSTVSGVICFGHKWRVFCFGLLASPYLQSLTSDCFEMRSKAGDFIRRQLVLPFVVFRRRRQLVKPCKTSPQHGKHAGRKQTITVRMSQRSQRHEASSTMATHDNYLFFIVLYDFNVNGT